MRYSVDFDRIGRNRSVPVFECEASSPDDLAEKIYRHVLPRLLSRDVEVLVNTEDNTGFILCGFQNGGTFTFVELTLAVTP